MQTLFKILINGTLFCLLWIIATLISNSIFNVAPPEAGNPSTILLLMWLCCLLEAAALHLYMINCRLTLKLRGASVFLMVFLIQFVFSQMETMFYLDDRTIPSEMVWATLMSGLIVSVLFSVFLSFRYPIRLAPKSPNLHFIASVPLVLILGLVIYPAIYFLAGYFIAWQSEALRIYYSGSPDLVTFSEIMKSNFLNGIYYFQAVRGIIWTLLGVIILRSLVPENWINHGMIVGTLFSLLMGSQLLLPNPYMPDQIRMMHALETCTSNFIWGLAIAYGYWQAKKFAFKSPGVSFENG